MSYGFYGGVHPAASKTLTSDKSIKKAFIPRKVSLPLSQHVGSPAEAVVKPGDMVKTGDIVGKPSGFVSSYIHASISGKVTKIMSAPTPTQPKTLSVIIEAQGDEDQEFRPAGPRDVDALSKEELLEIVRQAGIVGLGGAAFPTHVKLSPSKNKPIDTVILNGAECEPYLTCDHRLMQEKPKEILKGLDIITKILGAKNTYIAIEDNKLSSIYAMEKVLRNTRLVVLRAKYPQGAEKQIIKSVLDRVVPAGGLPMDVGCVVLNVGTAFAVYEAVHLGRPLIERVVTITGSCVKEPVNISVRIGTMLKDLEVSFGGFVKEPAKIISGGPMMGIAQYTLDIPIIKGTGGVIFLSKDEIDRSVEEVCIRCARCIEVCPMELVPTTLMYRVKKENFSEAEEMGIMNCYECGACAYSCPAKIPLVDYMKFGKAKLVKA